MSARVGILVYAVSLLLAGAAAAAERPANPEELWHAFPLDPTLEAPAAAPTLTLPVGDPHTPVAELPVEGPGAAQSDERAVAGFWSLLVLGGFAGSAAVVVAGGVALVRRRRTTTEPAVAYGESPRELIEAALALAREAEECDKLLHGQRREGVVTVSQYPDQSFDRSKQGSSDIETTAGTAPDAPPSVFVASGYVEIGERVAGVLSAAEVAAELIRADAQRAAEELFEQAKEVAERVRSEAAAYDSDTRAAVESYASVRRREAEQEERRLLEEAEAQARATREAAEEMARSIEEDARQRGQALREEFRSVEERLQRVHQGLRRMTAELEDVLRSGPAEESLADALQPAARHAEEDAALTAPRDDGAP